MYSVTPQGDLYEVLVAQELAAVGLIALILNIWTTNDNAAYAFGVAGSEAFEFNRKRPFVLVGGTIGIVLALAGVANLLIPWLSTLGQYIPPLGGVLIADFLLVWRLDVPRMEEIEFVGIRWTAVGAYVFGCVVATFTAGSVIPGVAVSKFLPGITSLNGIIAAMVAHAISYYALERTGVLNGHHVPDGARRV